MLEQLERLDNMVHKLQQTILLCAPQSKRQECHALLEEMRHMAMNNVSVQMDQLDCHVADVVDVVDVVDVADVVDVVDLADVVRVVSVVSVTSAAGHKPAKQYAKTLKAVRRLFVGLGCLYGH